ncbi:hypothetical protein EVAR_41911_1 [Eumeta japonica]|uniref:Uncharacterized protein n=1 Tax=Eumeta variegata TaxID=151549 RepID=A0A4C1XJH2_EUMVA|nr:hypothetical protein EVAR_41911_1 [Eumeta japonica]
MHPMSVRVEPRIKAIKYDREITLLEMAIPTTPDTSLQMCFIRTVRAQIRRDVNARPVVGADEGRARARPRRTSRGTNIGCMCDACFVKLECVILS